MRAVRDARLRDVDLVSVVDRSRGCGWRRCGRRRLVVVDPRFGELLHHIRVDVRGRQVLVFDALIVGQCLVHRRFLRQRQAAEAISEMSEDGDEVLVEHGEDVFIAYDLREALRCELARSSRMPVRVAGALC